MKQKDTLRRQRLIKNIPNSKDLKEASLKAGYSDNSRAIYSNSMKEYIKGSLEKQGFDKESLKCEFERIKAICESKEDYALVLRALEGIQKYHLRDNTTQQTAIFNLTAEDSDRLRAKLHNTEGKTETQPVTTVDDRTTEAE